MSPEPCKYGHKWSYSQPTRCLACGLLLAEAQKPSVPEPSLEDLFTALTQTGWRNFSIERVHLGDEQFPDLEWRVEMFRPSFQQTFYGASLRGALTAALTWTQEQTR